MTTLKEGDIEITVPPGVIARKFDDPPSHGLTNCMKAVDFVVDLPERRLFIEIKDPQDPRATENKATSFVAKFLKGGLDYDLRYKYRDSFLYELASGNDDRPIHYYVIVAISSLSPADLLDRTDALKRAVPLRGPRSGAWKRRIVQDCMVFNIETWNRHQPRLQLSRISG